MSASGITLQKKLNKEISSLIKIFVDKEWARGVEKLTFSGLFTNKLLIIQIIRAGVPYSLFDLIQFYAPFNEKDWSEILDISTKSLQRYKQSSKKFRPLQSGKIMEMAEVTNVGLDVFGDMEKFRLWLDTPNFSLGRMKPMELLKDSYGKEMVLGELTRINYGILA